MLVDNLSSRHLRTGGKLDLLKSLELVVERGKYLQVTTESKAVYATDLLKRKPFGTSKSWTKSFRKLLFKMQTYCTGNYEKRWYLLLHFPSYLECLKCFLNIPFHRTKFIEIYSTRRQG